MSEVHVIEREDEPFYTVHSLAKLLGISIGTAKTIVREGDIPSYKFRGNRRLHPADVHSYIARCRDDGRRAA